MLSACAPAATSTPFIAPRGPRITPSQEVSPVFLSPTTAVTQTIKATITKTLTPEPTSSPFLELPSLTPVLEPTLPEPTIDPNTPTPRSCVDSLRYLADLTYEDFSLVPAGQPLEKQWRVENNGTCDWDANYRLRLVDGFPPLGSTGEQALFPARAGAAATISINFTAPLEAGTYRTAWQAYSPEGFSFGEVIYMVIVVQ